VGKGQGVGLAPRGGVLSEHSLVERVRQTLDNFPHQLSCGIHWKHPCSCDRPQRLAEAVLDLVKEAESNGLADSYGRARGLESVISAWATDWGAGVSSPEDQ
jgi:hypothetical protein